LEGFGSYGCPTKSSILFGELATMLFQQWPTFSGDIFQLQSFVKSAMAALRMCYTHSGSARM